MRMSNVKQKNLLMIPEKYRLKLQKQLVLAILLILILLGLLAGMAQGTLGKFADSFIISDAAPVAKFGVTITTPKEFIIEDGTTSYEYYFPSPGQAKVLVFQAYNGGELDVICNLHIEGDLHYSLHVNREEQTEFVLKTKESAEIVLIIYAIGLSTTVTEVEFFLDTKQI